MKDSRDIQEVTQTPLDGFPEDGISEYKGNTKDN